MIGRVVEYEPKTYVCDKKKMMSINSLESYLGSDKALG
jgi:hypothetical protein